MISNLAALIAIAIFVSCLNVTTFTALFRLQGRRLIIEKGREGWSNRSVDLFVGNQTTPPLNERDSLSSDESDLDMIVFDRFYLPTTVFPCILIRCVVMLEADEDKRGR